MRDRAQLSVILVVIAAVPVLWQWWRAGFLILFNSALTALDVLWLGSSGIMIFASVSGIRSYFKRGTMTNVRRGAMAISALFLAIGFFADCNSSYCMVPGVSSCLTLLGAWLLPLGRGIAVWSRYIELLLSVVLAGFAVVVVLRPRRPRIVERPL